MLKIIERKKIWFSISIAIMIVGLIFGIINGVNIGIDFKGGTQLVLQLEDGYNKQDVDDIVAKYTDNYVSNTVDGSQYQVRSSNLDSTAVGNLVDELKDKYSLEDDEENKIIVSQDEIGASIGNDLKKNSLIALSIAFVVMLVYIAIRFEIKFGIAALLALVHDILITVSFYTIFDVQINSPFIAAILTVIGYSMNDTIVIFDRIRENVKLLRGKDYAEIANLSISETLRRSIYTSLTTLFTIVSVCVFVPSVRNFAMPLIVGIVAGAYSSIFIASPLWVMFKSKGKKAKSKDSKEEKKKLAKA